MCVYIYIYMCVCVTVNEASGIWSFHCQEAKYTFVAICAAIRRAEDHSLGNLEDALGEISRLCQKKEQHWDDNEYILWILGEVQS